MSLVDYPTHGLSGTISWQNGFKFPKAFVQELTEKFPSWGELQTAIKRGDKESVWDLLHAYQRKLESVTPEEIITADEEKRLKDLVIRAKESISMKKFIPEIEEKYFPKEVAERRRRQEVRRQLENAYYE